MLELLLLNIIGYCGALALLCLITDRAGTGSTFAHLFSLVWGPCILAAQCFTTSTQTLSSKTIVVLFGAWWALLAGALLTIRRQPATAPHEVTINKRRALALVFLLISLQATLVVYELPTDIAAQQGNKLVLALRTTHVSSGRLKCPWWLELFRGAYFIYIPLAVMLRKRDWLSRRMLCLLVVAACLLSLTRMTRAPLIGNIVTLWGSWTLLYKPRAVRTWGLLVSGLVAFGALFITIQAALQSNQAQTAGNIQLVEAYYGGPMRAFDSIVDGTFSKEPGYYSAEMFNYTLKKINIIDSYPSLIKPYTNGTNMYTFLDVYALDGGIFAALLGAALTGVAGAWLFTNASRHRSPLMLTSYALFAYCLTMAIANNEFIRIGPVLTIGLAGIVDRLVVSRRAVRAVRALSLTAAMPMRSNAHP